MEALFTRDTELAHFFSVFCCQTGEEDEGGKSEGEEKEEQLPSEDGPFCFHLRFPRPHLCHRLATGVLRKNGRF